MPPLPLSLCLCLSLPLRLKRMPAKTQPCILARKYVRQSVPYVVCSGVIKLCPATGARILQNTTCHDSRQAPRRRRRRSRRRRRGLPPGLSQRDNLYDSIFWRIRYVYLYILWTLPFLSKVLRKASEDMASCATAWSFSPRSEPADCSDGCLRNDCARWNALADEATEPTES